LNFPQEVSVVNKASGVQLSLKVAADVNARKLKRLWSQTPGLHNVVQTFPDESDEELSRLYVLEIEADAVTDAVQQLQAQPEIEYVDKPMRRRAR
jgi:hypothetical protein